MKGDKVARPSGKSTVPFPYYCTGVFASAESEAIEILDPNISKIKRYEHTVEQIELRLE